jgi:hypothetical protein
MTTAQVFCLGAGLALLPSVLGVMLFTVSVLRRDRHEGNSRRSRNPSWPSSSIISSKLAGTNTQLWTST